MRKAGEIISELFRENFGLEFTETAHFTVGLFSSWTRIVTEVWPRSFSADEKKADLGPQDIPVVAAHSRIRELERGVLLIEADHPGWIQILQTKQGELLFAVQKRYPQMDIRGITFRLSRAPFSPNGPEGPATKTEKIYEVQKKL